MRTKDQSIIQGTIDFAAKFGFVTEDLFFDFLCPRSVTRTREYWAALLNDGYFRESARNPKVLYFTKSGMVRAGGQCVKHRYFYHIDHDRIAAQIYLGLKSSGKLVSSWTEAQLRADSWTATSILGMRDAVKLPDLVTDLKGNNRTLRIAWEVEASRKSRARYDQISFSYLQMQKVDLVIYVCESEALEAEIKRAFSGETFIQKEKVPATLLLLDFRNEFFESPATLLGRAQPLRVVLAKALQLDPVSEFSIQFQNGSKKPDSKGHSWSA